MSVLKKVKQPLLYEAQCSRCKVDKRDEITEFATWVAVEKCAATDTDSAEFTSTSTILCSDCADQLETFLAGADR